jgi:hypothetical protein
LRKTEAPIGIFDSGVGGLTVARAVIDQLPNESILYVGDTAHGPYGPLPIAKVRAHALAVMDELVDSGVKLLVIACNSASAAVLRDARERYTARYGIPVIEVIQPAGPPRSVAATSPGDGWRRTDRRDGGLDHFDDGDAVARRVALPRVAQHRRRGRVAGDDQQLHAGIDELVHDRQGVGAHLRDRKRPVGPCAVSPTYRIDSFGS